MVSDEGVPVPDLSQMPFGTPVTTLPRTSVPRTSSSSMPHARSDRPVTELCSTRLPLPPATQIPAKNQGVRVFLAIRLWSPVT